MEVNRTSWSGDGAFTQLLIAALGEVEAIRHLRIEDAPATRVDAFASFISNELFVTFDRDGILRGRRPRMTLPDLELWLTARAGIGEPDYADEGMLQYLRTERIVPPYQTKGYKLVELVRIYRAGATAAPANGRKSGGLVS